MRKILLIILALVAIVAVYFLVTGRADVDQTRGAELPDVSAEGGQLPAFDVDVNAAGIERDAEKAGDAIEGAAEDVGNAVEDVDLPRVDVDADVDVNRQ